MEDKTFGYMLNMGIAVDKCLSATEANQIALMKQIRINKTQKVINVIMLGLIISCVGNITNLIKVVKHHDLKIKELESKSNENEQKGE